MVLMHASVRSTPLHCDGTKRNAVVSAWVDNL